MHLKALILALVAICATQARDPNWNEPGYEEFIYKKIDEIVESTKKDFASVEKRISQNIYMVEFGIHERVEELTEQGRNLVKKAIEKAAAVDADVSACFTEKDKMEALMNSSHGMIRECLGDKPKNNLKEVLDETKEFREAVEEFGRTSHEELENCGSGATEEELECRLEAALMAGISLKKIREDRSHRLSSAEEAIKSTTRQAFQCFAKAMHFKGKEAEKLLKEALVCADNIISAA